MLIKYPLMHKTVKTESGNNMENNDILLKLSGISKSFDTVRVLNDVNFTLKKGEILGLVGENGAGKSTLMKIIFGMSEIKQTGGYEGEIFFEGKKINFNSSLDALKAGIGMTHQEFSLIPGFTAAENIMLNMEPTKPNFASKLFGKRLETVNHPSMKETAKSSLDKLGLDIDVSGLVSSMPVAHKQFIEIAREITRDSVKLIILDEPTAVLTEQEAELLLKSMKRLSSLGVSMIFITHRLGEIRSICDKIVILRDGIIVKEMDNQNRDASPQEMASWMVGRNIAAPQKHERPKKEHLSDEIILDIKNLHVNMQGEMVRGLNLKVRKGEILGIAGLAGQGKLGITSGIMGLKESKGQIIFEGNELELNNPLKVLEAGIAFVSEDRRSVGLLLDEPVDWNITFSAMQVKGEFLKQVGPFRFRQDKDMEKTAQIYIEELGIKTTGPKQQVSELSGGNQQKVCLAKAFAMEPDLLIVSEPTRGIDVGAKRVVLDTIKEKKYKRGRNSNNDLIGA